MRRIVLAALVILSLSGCGGETDPAATPAGKAQARFIDDLYTGRYDQAYEALYPAHKRIVSRARFARCAKATVSGDLQSIEVLDVFDQAIQIPGVRERQAKAVRVRVTSTQGDTFTFVNHEVKVGGRWRWVFNAPAIRAYEAGRCPGA